MRRGEKLVGRVIGADGEAVADARVLALSAVVRGAPRATMGGSRAGGMSRVQYYRPREANADGRFELYIVPGAKTELVVHASQWAPQRVTVPAGKPDAGEIQLAWVESGRLLTASLGREGVGPVSKVARVVGEHPPPSIAPGAKAGEWYIAWLDYEQGYREPYAVRVECQ